tara:strand:- start:3080 stop:4045 length:966 start_codon:yes stop_codon:yes gene_type:complete
MSEAEKTEFEFPDEAEERESRAGSKVVTPEPEETEIEVVDDTPEEDRGRKPMEDPPKEMSDDELSKYDEGVRKRIQHFTKGYHEERRAKESALREREEAVRLTQQIVEENKKLKGSLHQGQSALLEQAKKVVAKEMDEAKRRFKEAYESGDADALTSAQEEMTVARIKADRVNNFRPAPVQTEENRVQIQQPAQVRPKLDSKTQEWTERNTWFGNDDEMTSFALGFHNKLAKSGITPSSQEYYERIDSRMKQVFPDAFESDRTDASEDATPSPKKSNVVAPATRSTAPKKIVLTKTQVQLAKRLGLTNEQYARAVAQEMRK